MVVIDEMNSLSGKYSIRFIKENFPVLYKALRTGKVGIPKTPAIKKIFNRAKRRKDGSLCL